MVLGNREKGTEGVCVFNFFCGGGFPCERKKGVELWFLVTDGSVESRSMLFCQGLRLWG